MIHGARAVLGEDRRHRRTIADVGADEDVIGIGENGRQIVEIARIGQLVDGDHALAIGDKRANQRRADKPGAAGHHHGHGPYSNKSGCAARGGSLRSRSESDRGLRREPAKRSSARIVPGDAALVRRAVEIGNLVLHLGVVLKGAVTMRKTRRHP